MCILRRSCACNRWIFPIFAYLIGGLILLQMRIRLFTIPNLLTLMNLLCGSFAVVVALMYNDLTLAFWLIVAGIVFDFFDGFVARLLHSSSAIGVQLDSLADVITSGLAPAAVLWQVCLQTEPCWLPETWKLGYGVRRFLRCVWPSSTSTKRRRSNSADFRRPPDRFSALRSACCGSRGRSLFLRTGCC